MMHSASRRIHRARIDLPRRSGAVHFSVDPSRPSWGHWWHQLFEYLLGLCPPGAAWRLEPVENVFVARPKLTADARRTIAGLLRAAPAAELAEHDTLRMAVELVPECEAKISLVLFAGA